MGRESVVFHRLEPRVLLNGGMVISEFMAVNDSTLLDGDENYSDWIEIHNPTTEAVPLDGWQLRDSGDTWTFPGGVTLGPGEFRVIFASDGRGNVPGAADPYLDGAGTLHTNFKLKSEGEYLGLLDAAGAVVHEYADYPNQSADISYGIAHETQTTEYVASGDEARYLVPAEDPGAWTTAGFDDSGWSAGRTGLGYSDLVPGFAVRVYKASGSVPDLDTALQVIATPSMQSAVYADHPTVVNYLNSGGGGHYVGDASVPGLSGPEDHYVIEAVGLVTIPSAGAWTFGVNSDDGFQVELGNGTDSFSMAYPGPRGAADTLSTFDIPAAGAYRLRLVFFDVSDASAVELWAGAGSHAAWSAGAFDLVGDIPAGGLAVESLPFDAGAAGLAALIEADVRDRMQGASASLLARLPFTVDDPSVLESLTLKMKYDDG